MAVTTTVATTTARTLQVLLVLQDLQDLQVLPDPQDLLDLLDLRLRCLFPLGSTSSPAHATTTGFRAQLAGMRSSPSVDTVT